MTEKITILQNAICTTTQWLNANISTSAIIALVAIVVALLIPIVFFIMDKNDSYNFDKNVILDKIFRFKCLIPIILATSLLAFFESLIILTLLSSVGLLIVSSRVFYCSYKWLRTTETKYNSTYRQEKRIEYLKSIKSHKKELLEVWNLIFYDEKFLEKNQTGLIDVFLETTQKYEDDFLKNKILNENRNFVQSLLTFDNLVFDIDDNEDFLHTKLVAWAEKKRNFGHSTRGYVGYAEEEREAELFAQRVQKETIFFLKEKIKWLNNINEIQRIINMIEQIENEKLFEENPSEHIRLINRHFNSSIFLLPFCYHSAEQFKHFSLSIGKSI